MRSPCTVPRGTSGTANVPNARNSYWNFKGPTKSGTEDTYFILVNPFDHRIHFHLFLNHINQCSLEHILEDTGLVMRWWPWE